MEAAFHATAVRAAAKIELDLGSFENSEKFSEAISSSEDRKRMEVEYVIASVPVWDLESGLFRTRIGDCAKEFSGLSDFRLEKVRAKISGANAGRDNRLFLSTTNRRAAVHQAGTKVHLSDVPSRLACDDESDACQLVSGSEPISPHSLWTIRLEPEAGHRKSNALVDIHLVFAGTVSKATREQGFSAFVPSENCKGSGNQVIQYFFLKYSVFKAILLLALTAWKPLGR
jgi:hypothetical protein